jgi:hypothetical protein
LLPDSSAVFPVATLRAALCFKNWTTMSAPRQPYLYRRERSGGINGAARWRAGQA